MQLESLYNDLRRAYSSENLNRISSEIINLYKSGDYTKLRKVHALIFSGNEGNSEKISRVFSSIITLYHPDRQEQITNKIRYSYQQNDLAGLQIHQHILDVEKMDLSEGEGVDIADTDFDYEDIWDFAAQGYSYIDDEEHDTEEHDYYDDSAHYNDFLAAVKRKIYGYLKVDFPVNLLADMEIIEMSEYDIESLDGVEYCTYARIIDLSGNNLTEIYQLSQAMHLEEVYLQDNYISYLDGLNELPFLRVLDVSDNELDDVSPLFEIESLEFLNVMGNRIPPWQLEKLSMNGVVIVA